MPRGKRGCGSRKRQSLKRTPFYRFPYKWCLTRRHKVHRSTKAAIDCDGAAARRRYTGALMNTSILISILITFLVIILVLYLINMLPIDGRAKQIVRIVVIIIGVLSLLKYLAIY